jgi:hypothetical protein
MVSTVVMFPRMLRGCWANVTRMLHRWGALHMRDIRVAMRCKTRWMRAWHALHQSPNERLSFICSAYFRVCIVVTKQIGNPWRCLECGVAPDVRSALHACSMGYFWSVRYAPDSCWPGCARVTSANPTQMLRTPAAQQEMLLVLDPSVCTCTKILL